MTITSLHRRDIVHGEAELIGLVWLLHQLERDAA